jgi:hypothetical protein
VRAAVVLRAVNAVGESVRSAGRLDEARARRPAWRAPPLGVIESVADSWPIGAGLLLILATAGFFGLLAVVRLARAVTLRPT